MPASMIASWVTALTADRLPADVVAAAERSILDTEGVAIAGATLDVAAKVAAFARATYGAGRATCFVAGAPALTAGGAAVANAAAAHAFDFDDTSYSGIVHGSAMVWPVVRALAEETGASGPDALVAFVAGVETIYALGAVLGVEGYDAGIWNSTLLGTVGAAAAASRLLHLDVARTTAALALATGGATGVRSVFGSDAKPALLGLATGAGLAAAQMAAAGVGAPSHVLDPDGRWWRLIAHGAPHAEIRMPDGAVPWRLVAPGIAFKLYPVCSAAAAAIEATRGIAVTAADVRKVRVTVTDFVASCLVHDCARSRTEAQFSMPFAVAAALLDRDVTLASLSPAALARPVLQDLMGRVEMVVDAAFSTRHRATGALEAAHVTVERQSGVSIGAEVAFARGLPQRPATTSELRAKFVRCGAYAGLTEAEAIQRADRLSALRELPDLRNLGMVVRR